MIRNVETVELPRFTGGTAGRPARERQKTGRLIDSEAFGVYREFPGG